MSEAKDDKDHGTGHIIQSLLVNLLIAVVKAGAAFYTKSGAMLAEALHSFSDCGNQILLLVGVRQARKPPDEKHPLGYGRAVYFWSFMVALLLFLGGGAFSVYEGVHKVMHPEAVENVWVGLGILAVSLLLEGGATLSNIKELNKRRGKKPFMKYLRDTTDSDLVVVFGENSAAVLGLGLAIIALGLAAMTGDGKWDGVGSIAIGLVLVGVAVFLAVEVSSLLIGEAADPEVVEVAKQIVKDLPDLDQVLNIVTMQQGPGEVLVHMKIAVNPAITVERCCDLINEFEARFRKERPECRWVYVEPDTVKTQSELQRAKKAPAAGDGDGPGPRASAEA
jgi:cation diffusion facilitator family transporter